MDELEKVFAGKMDCYPKVANRSHRAAELIGMTPETEVIGIADGGIGLSEELKKQFPSILDFALLKSEFLFLSNLLKVCSQRSILMTV